ncbi:11914_t:CDS:2, partial [Diversispora eburnea]
YDYFELQPGETILSICSVTFSDKTEYFVAGTDPGRILIFQVEKEGINYKIKLVYQKEVLGSVYSALAFDEKLLIGIDGKVSIFDFIRLEDGKRDLIPICEYNGFTLAIQIVTRGHFILVGDIMRSIVLLAYKETGGGGGGKTLEFVTQDLNDRWINAIETLNDDEFICCESQNNSILTFRRNVDTSDVLLKEKLDMVGIYNYGDSINRFRHGSLAANVSEPIINIESRVLFVTSSGAIGIIIPISQKQFDKLKKLQDAYQKVVGFYGGLDIYSWRSVIDEECEKAELRNFIDGDVIESLLDNPTKVIGDIGDSCDLSVNEIRKLVEELTRMH